MITYAVTVTYGNRFHFLKQVIEGALSAGIEKVIVVDNASEDESRSQLMAYEKANVGKIKVCYQDTNYGSAGGFKIGFQEAYSDQKCQYILALDDDNLISKNTLTKLAALLIYLDQQKDNIMLSLYRDIFNKDIIKKGYIKGYKKNNFMGLNFLTLLKNRFFRKEFLNDMLFPLHPESVAAMGGLFFNKTLISKLGYPLEEFVVYADDHEFTYRFSKMGGKIFMCSEIPIIDLDISYDKKSSIPSYFDKDFSEFKIYYTVRNHTYFSKQFIDNKLFFYSNMIIYLFLQVRYLHKVPFGLYIQRLKLIVRAINDGLHDRLGKSFS